MAHFLKRKEFSFLWTSKATHKVVVAARGSGKTVAAVQYVVERLLTGKRNGSAVFFSGTLGQAKKTVEPVMREIIQTLPDGLCVFNQSEYFYKFVLAKDDIRYLYLFGYENSETKRGVHPQTIVLDECADMPADMYGSVIEPMIVDKNGVTVAIGTAKGENMFYELFRRGTSPDYPDWESLRVRASDCGNDIFPADVLWEKQNNLTKAQYAQEYECDFSANVLVGSVYGEFMDRFTVNNTSSEFIWDPEKPVFCSWDLGYSDYVSVWFFQVRHDVVTFIDYFEDNKHEIPYYADVLLKKPYAYHTMILPHDGAHANLRGAPVKKQLNDFGLRAEVLPRGFVQEGVDKARSLLKVARFNADKCALGLKRLKSFKYKINKQTGKTLDVFDDGDECIHCADSFRYAAMSRHIWGKQQDSSKIIINRCNLVRR